jgi:hypothetical protein
MSDEYYDEEIDYGDEDLINEGHITDSHEQIMDSQMEQ